jgi:hypothetical protein
MTIFHDNHKGKTFVVKFVRYHAKGMVGLSVTIFCKKAKGFSLQSLTHIVA